MSIARLAIFKPKTYRFGNVFGINHEKHERKLFSYDRINNIPEPVLPWIVQTPGI
jgi:hypothetical protein